MNDGARIDDEAGRTQASCSTQVGTCPACGRGRFVLLLGLLAVAGIYLYTSRPHGPPPSSAVNWVEDYDSGLAAAKSTHQPVLLAFKASWCGGCKWMDAEVFSNQAAAKALTGWVPVHVDVDEQRRIAAQYGIRAIPTLVALSPEGKELQRAQGPLDLQQFAEFLARSDAQTPKTNPAGS